MPQAPIYLLMHQCMIIIENSLLQYIFDPFAYLLLHWSIWDLFAEVNKYRSINIISGELKLLFFGHLMCSHAVADDEMTTEVRSHIPLMNINYSWKLDRPVVLVIQLARF